MIQLKSADPRISADEEFDLDIQTEEYIKYDDVTGMNYFVDDVSLDEVFESCRGNRIVVEKSDEYEYVVTAYNYYIE